MRQVTQSLSTGATELIELPAPRIGDGDLLIRTTYSLLSAGTERMLVDFGRAGLLSKARQQPERVRQVIDKMRTDGVLSTLSAVKSKLEQPIPLGYCNAGVVEAVGADVRGFKEGDRVVSNGPHAELVAVPENLCARIPKDVPEDAAAFTVLGAIGLQGVRLAEPTLGECFVVTGLGLVGLLTAQILRAHGCRVLGIDLDPGRLGLARRFGVETVDLSSGEDVQSAARLFSRGRGVDGVIIAAATDSNEPVSQAAQMCRKRGRIVLVGVAGLALDRSLFFEKELSFQVSCSYGPGRYDPKYEEEGQDYPLAYVRWTEQRNFEAFLDLLDQGSVKTAELVSHRFAFDKATDAYDLLTSDEDPHLGIILEYPVETEAAAPATSSVVRTGSGEKSRGGAVAVGVIGAGNYAGRVLVPAFRKAGAVLRALANNGGVRGHHVATRNGFERLTTDVEELLSDPDVDAIVVATRHDSHARLVTDALRAGKHVFCEKPLALSHQELDDIEAALRAHGEEAPILTVGFNRRFAPLMQTLKGSLDRSTGPLSIVYTCNAGRIPADSWVHDPVQGGGRLLGEACHFIDVARHLTGSRIVDSDVQVLSDPEGLGDTATLNLSFGDGSIASVHYFANGNRAFPKERIEVFQEGRIHVLDNFRSLRGVGTKVRGRSWRQDKGQDECVRTFLRAVAGEVEAPIPVAELLEVSRVTVDLALAARP